MFYVARRPFKSLGEFYPAGTVLDGPGDIKYFRDKVDDGIIILVTERNLDAVGHYLEERMGVEGATTKLKAKEQKIKNGVKEDKPSEDTEYLEKVKKAAKKYKVDMEGKELEDVVKEIKEKQAEAKTTSSDKK